MTKLLKKKIIFSNEWIKLIKKRIKFLYKGTGDYYSVEQRDYVYVLLQTSNNLFPMVKQYRHAINKYTLEFPSGLLEDKESPNECARREVMEETGHLVKRLIKLSTIYPDSGRLSNKVHMFYAKSDKKKIKKIDKNEEIKIFYYSKEQIKKLIKANKILHQPHIGLFYKALIHNLI